MEYVCHNYSICLKSLAILICSDTVRKNQRGLHSHLAAKLRENSMKRLSKYAYVYFLHAVRCDFNAM